MLFRILDSIIIIKDKISQWEPTTVKETSFFFFANISSINIFYAGGHSSDHDRLGSDD